jgi:hypothetical protein
MVQCSLLFSQEGKVVYDTLLVQKDSIIADTIIRKRTLSSNAIDKPITHIAKGYRKTDFVTKKVYLVDEGVVTYGDIILKADSIVLNMETGVVFAIGRRDSTGKTIGSPVFQQGTETFESKELTYNFKTKKGLIKNIITKQEDGYLHSAVTKRLSDGNLNINTSTYSTCDALPPHFYVGFNKAKVVPGKKIITGPAYLVLEDIPLPLVLPFGYFPIQTKRAASGILIPKPTQTFQLGYGIRDGGYYFAVNDNFDLTLLGSLYTNGTWMLNTSSGYVKRYKYSGKFSFSYAKNISGHKGLSDYSKNSNYRIDWTYNQDAKAHPGSRFTASVNMSSSGFDRTNSYVPAEHVTTTRQSSVSYSKSWEGTPFNFSTSLNQSQNVSNKTVSLNLPKASFNMARIYPLKSKNRVGPSKWYQELQFQYSASIDNQINTVDSLLFTKEVFKNMRSGFRHEAPLSLQLRPFKNFTISPQVSYTGVLYSQKFEQRWIPDYFNQDINKIVPTVIKDTVRGFFYGQSVKPSISAGFNPQIFGMYLFKKPGGRLQAIRHIIKPSVGFSYVPVFKGLTTDMFRTVQVDTSGRLRPYSIFDGNIFGTPSLPTRSGNLSFSLVNIVEAKVFARNDTTGKPKKVKIIDNFTINTSYNIFADSLRWAPVSMSYRTTLFGNINIAANSSFSLYGQDTKGRTIGTFYYQQTKKLMRMTSLSVSLDFDLGQLLKSGKSQKKQGQSSSVQAGIKADNNPVASRPVDQSNTTKIGSLPLDEYGYAQFNVPWSLRAAYSFYYSKPTIKSVITQNLSLSGNLTLTSKTMITFTSGYDISRKQITMTSIGISRDLHCWQMNVEWIPTGYMKSWMFTIRVKASVLADLKYERRKDFHDQY